MLGRALAGDLTRQVFVGVFFIYYILFLDMGQHACIHAYGLRR